MLRENNKVIVQIIKKIEEIKSGIEIEHDALKKCFQEINDLTKRPSISPNSIEFLKPYL